MSKKSYKADSLETEATLPQTPIQPIAFKSGGSAILSFFFTLFCCGQASRKHRR